MFLVLCVCALVLLGSTFSASSARARQSNLHLVRHSEEEPPPLEGCEDNSWYTTCCCFVDFGVLKQQRCGCTSNPNSCTGKAQIEYNEKPSEREDVINALSPKLWHTEAGYIRGYQAVSDVFCQATPVVGAQVESWERAYECTCSNSMSQIHEMKCGSSCNVANCQRWNEFKVDWIPFMEGRGKCCLSSYVTSSGGCLQEVEPITEDGASVILHDAINHALVNHTHAFVPQTSEHLMQDMVKSFNTAKEKKMTTSRSGAQFFFSGDYKYILKSIHKPEYDVLEKITHSLPSGKMSLVDHIREATRAKNEYVRVGYCKSMYVSAAHESMDASDSSAHRLAGLVSNQFYGHWYYDDERSKASGTPVYLQYFMNICAYWCGKASEWRFHYAVSFPRKPSACEDREGDPLYEWLVQHRDTADTTMENVAKVYEDFIQAFEQRKMADRTIKLNFMFCKCTMKWFPASLINQFAIAFEYRTSTWMVVKNTVSSVEDELKAAGFTNFYKKYSMFDVKPFPIHSDEREPLFKMHFAKAGISRWRNWESVKKNVQKDVQFMDNVLDNPMVDYSFLVSVFYINSDRMALDEVQLPNCVEQRLTRIRTITKGQSDYGDAPGSILVCFSIIDMLMEFTLSKKPENALLCNKWSSWGKKIMQLLTCLGDPDKHYCGNYKELQSKFDGVDIPDVPTAQVQDVSNLFNGDGEVRIVQHQYINTKNFLTYHMMKCCCNSVVGKCVLKDASKKSTSWLYGNPRGCGKLAGSGWHSFWREAGSCRVALNHAESLRKQVVANNIHDL